MNLIDNEWHFYASIPKVMYMGIDCSSKAIHAVLIDDNERVIGQGKWTGKSSDFATKFLEMIDNFNDSFSNINHAIIIASIESSIFIQNPKTSLRIATVVAGCLVICHQNSTVCVEVDNRKWKKYILGKGNSNKQDIKNWTDAKWSNTVQFTEQDWSDASCIAIWSKRSFKNEFTEN